MTRPLPDIRYFADPIAHGCVETSSEACACCGEANGFLHTAGIHAYEDQKPDGDICPWCIADGTASLRYASDHPASFNDAQSSEGRDEVNYRTPSIISWQGWFWPT